MQARVRAGPPTAARTAPHGHGHSNRVVSDKVMLRIKEQSAPSSQYVNIRNLAAAENAQVSGKVPSVQSNSRT